MANVLDGLRAAPSLLALAYGAYGVYILTRLRTFLKYSHNRILDTRKLLATSMFFVCVFRCLTFVTIALVNHRGYSLGFHGSGSASVIVVQEGGLAGHHLRSSNLDFFEKSMLVLFDLPDYMIVTTFTLLVLVWAEVFLDSRAHWLSARKFRKRALLGYLVFNATVYATQLVLYSLLFVPRISIRLLRFLLFCSVGFLNFLVPVAYLCVAFYLYCKFAAFPYKGMRSRLALARTSRVVAWWTAGRLVWAAVALSAGIRDWLTNFTGSSELYAVALVAVFALTELVPFSIALEPEFLPILTIAGPIGAVADNDPSALTAKGGGREEGYRQTGPAPPRTARSSSGSGLAMLLGLARQQSTHDYRENDDGRGFSAADYGTMDMREIELQLASPRDFVRHNLETGSGRKGEAKSNGAR